MATKAEVRNRVAGLLGRLRLGQAVDDALKTRIDNAYSEVYDDLKDDQLVTWAVDGTIPDKVSPHLSALMAFNCCTDVGVSEERYRRIVNMRNIAKREIRRVTTPKYETLDDAEDF